MRTAGILRLEQGSGDIRGPAAPCLWISSARGGCAGPLASTAAAPLPQGPACTEPVAAASPDAWIHSVAPAVKAVVRGKERRLRHKMQALGLGSAVLWLGWFPSCHSPFLGSTALLVLVTKVRTPRPSPLRGGCARAGPWANPGA